MRGNFFPAGDILRVKGRRHEAHGLAEMTTDDQLAIEFQQGSRDAFRELFERYREPIYGFFRRRLDNPARAEELAQECFLALLRNAKRYEPRAAFRSYLYGVALNMLSAERRKSGREVANDGQMPDPPVNENTDASVWVRQALERLETNDREILMLREYEQLSYAEIAGLLRLPVNTVRSRLFRARMALREQLAPVQGKD
ncbi:MAG TPA: RNA polymerase sigma factor [Candidatus Acidoferrum sp.]|nr:RNA polymerase sigma factor [Candidatus Acidoferrum sp.]